MQPRSRPNSVASEDVHTIGTHAPRQPASYLRHVEVGQQLAPQSKVHVWDLKSLWLVPVLLGIQMHAHTRTHKHTME
jgi:hypothetical protein